MNILAKYPSRNRPNLFKARWNNWNNQSSQRYPIHWLCSFDEDDPTMNNPDIQSFCNERMIEYHYGNSKTKIEACNADLDKTTDRWEALILISDDMECRRPYWDKVIAQDFNDNLNQGIWYNDNRQDNLCTLSVFGRPIYQEFGYVYHPAFKTWYADNYYHYQLESTNRLKRSTEYLVKHQWRKENDDTLMDRNNNADLVEQDRQTYYRLLGIASSNNKTTQTV